jgi:16S rRNA (guanine527-N7)-methyltransferase
MLPPELPMDASTAGPIAALARQLGLVPDERQLQQLQDYLAMLLRWNKTYNLTALRDPAQMFTHHLAD